MRVIMLSAPGAGKGTQAKLLAQATGIVHMSSGDLLRRQIAAGGELGRRVAVHAERGDLVPDDLLFEILVPAVIAAASSGGGYLLDGFPRTMPQALRAAQLGVELGLSSDAVVYLDAPRDVLIRRLNARAAVENRVDDTPQVITHRLAVFEERTRPLVEYYRDRGILVELDADRPEPEVHADLRTRLIGERS
jgi:adenylate kinase